MMAGMAVLHDMIGRAVWEEPGWRVGAHTNSGPQPWNRAEYVVIHYTAAAGTPEDYDGVLAKLRQSQRSYVTSRGYSYGYNWEVDRAGRIWEIRGDDYMCAANGNTDSNSRGPAILCLVNGAEPANQAMIDSVRRVVAYCEQRAGRTLRVVGHRDVRATACPGAGLYAQVQNGTFRPQPIPPLTPEMTMRLVDPPQRLLDTRQTRQPKDGETIYVQIPGSPKAAFVNITIVNPAKGGFCSAFNPATGKPATSNVNFPPPGQAVCNTSWVACGGNGMIGVYVSASAHLIVDLQAVAS